jgi:molecular chaperone GrpE
MATEDRNQEPTTEEPVVVRDRRKIDPDTGEVREHDVEAEELLTEEEPVDPGVELQKQLDERTADLQRLQAEFANYRRRVERDREVASNAAKAGLLSEFLTVLDDVERADQHGDLTGAFKAVSDKFVGVLQKSGLEPFGTENEPFDPSVHEAVQHTTSSEVDGPTVSTVLRRGYKVGDKVVRAAMVAVTDYEAPAETVDAEVVDAEVIDSEVVDSEEK